MLYLSGNASTTSSAIKAGSSLGCVVADGGGFEPQPHLWPVTIVSRNIDSWRNCDAPGAQFNQKRGRRMEASLCIALHPS